MSCCFPKQYRPFSFHSKLGNATDDDDVDFTALYLIETLLGNAADRKRLISFQTVAFFIKVDSLKTIILKLCLFGEGFLFK